MRSLRFSLFGHTLVTFEDFSHSLLAPVCPDSHEIEFLVHRQQQAPEYPLCHQIFPQDNALPKSSASLYLYRGENFMRIEYIDFATYDLFDDRIVCYAGTQAGDKRLHLNFLGPVMSLWLERHGTLVLHASAMLVENKAVLFLADSGQGKSTVAASMIQAGFPILSDDLAALKYNPKQARFYVYPSYPVIKLWPDQFKRLFQSENSDDYLDKELKKCRLRVDNMNSALFCTEPHPISVIYHLKRNEALSDRLITPLSNVEALTNLVRYSFAAPIMIATRWQAGRLKKFSKLISHVPMRDAVYPTGMRNLKSLSSDIVSDLKSV